MKANISENLSVSPRPKILIITGPTAVGKSSTAASICQTLNGEIISADSVQIYKKLNIGSNKVSVQDRAEIPHHLIDFVDPALDSFTAADFFRIAREKTFDILQRRRLPIVVGGTMMYVRWFIYGKPATPPADKHVKAKVKEAVKNINGDWDAALTLLAAKDSKRAQELSRNDWYRLTRALEIVETAGIAMTDIPLRGGAPRTKHCTSELDFDFRCVFLHSDRIQLNRRIDERCEEMILPRNDAEPLKEWQSIFEKSILTEVSRLLACRDIQVSSSSPAFAIGYRQTIFYLVNRAMKQHESTHDSLASSRSEIESTATNHLSPESIQAFRSFVSMFQSATRGYAKEQTKWFRKEELFYWIKADSNALNSISNIMQMNESEYQQLQECNKIDQSDMRQQMMERGKDMKRYITENKWLKKGSMAESQAIILAERCALEIVRSLTLEELESMKRILAR